MSRWNRFRTGMLGGFIVSLLLVTIALLMQYRGGLEPCPLCLLQRLAVLVLGLVYLIALLHNPASIGRRLYGLLLLTGSLFGLLIAARHVWLQHLPEERVPECGPGLQYWLENLPLSEIFSKVFQGSGECAQVALQVAGLSIAEWMLIVFALYSLHSLKIIIYSS